MLQLIKFILFSLAIFPLAHAASDGVDEIYQDLKNDFDSKPYFFNSHLNDYRDGVMSIFVPEIYGDPYNNARPLTPLQIRNLPEGHFLEKKIFSLAMAGRQRLLAAGKIKKQPLMAVVDFSKNSKIRRFYLLNLDKREVLINTWTSHGSPSDNNKDGYPETFSNKSGSNMSSVGFMSTDVAYYGNWGYSLRLRGHDPILNSNVLSRAVVIHGFGGIGAHEASWGNISTSQGCFMFSLLESGRFWGMDDRSMRDIVIDTMKAGALLFAYTDVEDDEGKPLILQSNWIKASDIPAEEEQEEEAIEETPEREMDPVVDEDPNKVVVSHPNPFRGRLPLKPE